MNLNSKQQHQLAGLLAHLEPETGDSILNRFDPLTRSRIRKILDTPSFGEPVSEAMDEFARFVEQTRSNEKPGSAGGNSDTRFGVVPNSNSGQRPLNIETLVSLDDATLDTVLEAVPPDITVRLLRCSPMSFVRRVLSRLTHDEAESVVDRITESGPCNFDEMQDIHLQYCQCVRELINRGTISLTDGPL